jgi:hypothetical protein
MTLAGMGSTQKLQVNGINVGTNPTTFNSVNLRMENAGTFTAFNNVSFTGYTGFTGAIVDVARAGATGMSSLNFGLVTGLGGGGIFVENSGPGALTITGSTPATGVLNTHYRISGAGSVSWP